MCGITDEEVDVVRFVGWGDLADFVTRSCWSCVICGVVARLTPNLELRPDSNTATRWRIIVLQQDSLGLTDINIIDFIHIRVLCV